jgi:hypothetical protein
MNVLLEHPTVVQTTKFSSPLTEPGAALLHSETRGIPHPSTKLGRKIEDRLNSGLSIFGGINVISVHDKCKV